MDRRTDDSDVIVINSYLDGPRFDYGWFHVHIYCSCLVINIDLGWFLTVTQLCHPACMVMATVHFTPHYRIIYSVVVDDGLDQITHHAGVPVTSICRMVLSDEVGDNDHNNKSFHMNSNLTLPLWSEIQGRQIRTICKLLWAGISSRSMISLSQGLNVCTLKSNQIPKVGDFCAFISPQF